MIIAKLPNRNQLFGWRVLRFWLGKILGTLVGSESGHSFLFLYIPKKLKDSLNIYI